ncbi:MAG: putative sugar O-methyltransferase [Candidatus Parcubacteria bacterium]|nr:putative sugar O-methyltransferase [Candidatus Parcubacteria bacterium]
MSKQTLKEMLEEMKSIPSIYRPSDFWIELSKLHLTQLSYAGFENFKRSVTAHYFNWKILMIIRHQLSPIFSELMKKNFAPIFKSRFINPLSKGLYTISFNRISAIIYSSYVAFLKDYVSHRDKLKLLDRLKEPLIGNPFLVKYKNQHISQDLCNSIYEFYSISNDIDSKIPMNIAELGAGYGRLAHVFLETLPKSSYCIIDIPPALFISQEYLSKLFPKEKIFYFRPFSSFEKVRKEFESARIRFLMPHQIEYLPDKYFNLMISISTLHEMTREQIKNYILQINRMTAGYFYNKQWRKSYAKDNSHIKEKEYPIPKNWITIYQNRHSIQRLFFEALYKIPKL